MNAANDWWCASTQAFRPFERAQPPFPYFHDASPFVCTYNLSILDCLRGMRKAFECKFFSFDKFDINEYEYFEKVENGDLNWLHYGRFLAFAGPHETRQMTAEGYHTLCPDDYIPYFKKKGVSLVIRLNKKYYNQKRFTNAGIDHLDLYYMDGSTPPKHILEKFIQACENAKGAIAVHCKAGLGRTGTCIGAYMMKHHKFTAGECVVTTVVHWNRVHDSWWLLRSRNHWVVPHLPPWQYHWPTAAVHEGNRAENVEGWRPVLRQQTQLRYRRSNRRRWRGSRVWGGFKLSTHRRSVVVGRCPVWPPVRTLPWHTH